MDLKVKLAYAKIWLSAYAVDLKDRFELILISFMIAFTTPIVVVARFTKHTLHEPLVWGWAIGAGILIAFFMSFYTWEDEAKGILRQDTPLRAATYGLIMGLAAAGALIFF